MNKHRIPSRFFTLLVYVFLYAPIVLLIVFSFNATKSNRVWGGFSTQWYVELFHNTRLLGGFCAPPSFCRCWPPSSPPFWAPPPPSASTPCAGAPAPPFLAVNNIPLTNADIITGVSMMLLFVFAIGVFNDSFLSELLGVRWRTGFGTLLIAHITFNAPYVILSVMPKLRQLDPNIYEAAQDLGAPGFLAFRKVILPEIMPGVLNGLIIAFTMSIDDFVISYFTKGSGVTTLAVEIYTMVKKPVTPEINAPVHPDVPGGVRPAAHRQHPSGPAGDRLRPAEGQAEPRAVRPPRCVW